MSATASDTSPTYDLTTVTGRAAWLSAVLAHAIEQGKAVASACRVWTGSQTARIYIERDYIELDDNGDLTFGGGAWRESRRYKWMEVESDLIETTGATFRTGPVARTGVGPRPGCSCRGCGAPVQAWSDGLSRGLCHDCA